jgi:hypothetical protein
MMHLVDNLRPTEPKELSSSDSSRLYVIKRTVVGCRTEEADTLFRMYTTRFPLWLNLSCEARLLQTQTRKSNLEPKVHHHRQVP